MGATVPVLVSLEAGGAGPALAYPNHIPQPPVAFPASLLGTELVGAPRGPVGSILPSPCITQCSSLQPMGTRVQQGCVYSFSPAPSPPPAAGFLSPTSPQQTCASCPFHVFTVVSGEWRAHGQSGCPKAGMGAGFPQNQLLTGRKKTLNK